MIKRVLLDKEVVDSAIVPLSGEAWISDSKVKGFGLRMYNGANGPSRSFAIRTTNSEGRSVRKTFDVLKARYEEHHRSRWSDYLDTARVEVPWDVSIGRYTKVARQWALNEIRTLKGLPTLLTENSARETTAERVLNGITLERAAQAVIANYRKMKLSITYVDRVDKLLANLVSPALKAKTLSSFSEDDANKLHFCCEGLSGNKRTLVPFLGRVFQLHQDLVGGRNVFAITKGGQFIQTAPNKDFEIDDTSAEKIKALLEYLENITQNWQQSYCLRIYFETHAPLTTLMGARWDQLLEWSNPYWNRPEVPVWKYGERLRDIVYLSGVFDRLLSSAKLLANDQFPGHEHFFPSAQSRQFAHIRSVEPFWATTLHKFGLPYLSPKKLREAIQLYGAWIILDGRK